MDEISGEKRAEEILDSVWKELKEESDFGVYFGFRFSEYDEAFLRSCGIDPG